MDAKRGSEPTPMKNRTTVERKSERELVVTRTVNGPARIVFEAWTARAVQAVVGPEIHGHVPAPARWMLASGSTDWCRHEGQFHGVPR